MTYTISTWKLLLLLLTRLRIVNLQIQMFHIPQPMPQIFALPPPPPIAVPVPIPIPIPQSTTTSTTTTTEQNMAIAIPFPMPLPIQIAMPAMPPPSFCQANSRPVNCPPCPPCICAPSCTPAFFSFCSPCHQKCKCNKREDVPRPLPPRPPQPLMGPAFPMPVPFPPMVGPPPVVVLPYPARSNRGKRTRHVVSSSEDTSSTSSSEWSTDRRNSRSNTRNKKRLRNSRRSYKVSDMEVSDSELVKPVLTYVSQNGDVKLKQRISADEAAQLLGEKDMINKPHQRIVITRGNDAKQSQVLVLSDNGEEPSMVHRRKQVVLRRGASQHILGDGKKELVFRPPDDKIISNLSVSFQVI